MCVRRYGRVEEQLISLLALALGRPSGPEGNLNFSELLQLAQKHSVANMLYYALPHLPAAQQPTPAERKLCKELAYAAATREAVQQRETDALIAHFAQERIAVLPLKGYVIKRLYPKPEMRSMSDTDLLFDPSQAARIKAVMDELGYTTRQYDEGDTDVYLSPAGMSYEFHRSLTDEGYSEGSRQFLGGLLSCARPVEENSALLALPHEEHYAYLLCHFVKHLTGRGIGVRQVMDIYLCRRRWTFDEKRLHALLERIGLAAFAETVEQLAVCWFGGGTGDAVTDELGAYILGSGTFGTLDQRTVNRMAQERQRANRVSFALRRIFPPYSFMAKSMPSLKKVPFLLLFYWIARILRSIFCRRQRLSGEMNTVLRTSDETVNERAAFFRRCGLEHINRNDLGGQP